MSRKREFIRIARQAGILKVEIQYDRPSKAYSISITDVLLPRSKGYTSLGVGLYHTFDDAKTRLPDDIQACVDRSIDEYPTILEGVSDRYYLKATVEQSDQDITYHLLESLLKANDRVTAESAQIALEYLASLESQIKGDLVNPKGTYRSKYPDQQKKPINWKQPDYREHPVYIFEVHCSYCGQDVTLERHSPRQPAYCGKPDCGQEHTRTLARERKRRQRERAKRNK